LVFKYNLDTLQNFNEIIQKKGHKKIIDEILNRLEDFHNRILIFGDLKFYRL